MTLFGIEIFVSNEQSQKAFFPIEMTLFGIEIFVSNEKPIKHSGSICKIPLGIEILEILSIRTDLLLPEK